ncbi:MAG: protein kinase [Phycisphaerales bacterium]
MSVGPKDEKSIFEAAMALKTPAEREAYLGEACGSDTVLRARITALVVAREDQTYFLNQFVPPSESVSHDLVEACGTVIDRYKLLEKIGEGGMAVVYMAEQEQPIHRKVALKIIKLGMDTRQVIARFEAERQVLALMDHPNIAKVLDAGATETGRPYFVMELVQGVSITEYCDRNSLSTKDRLGLFIQVCSAVQHAHQKGIIHRDIKPSNVMVTHHDGKPVPKVIDFGIAKATNQRLTEKTLFTRYAHLIGTPAYMSPEQAELSDLDIDTRTDIYSLGVLLYELLTGTTPFSEEELRKAGYVEMQRVIREQEPVKPSTRLTTLGDTLTDIARHRGCTPDLLRKAVRGDLDWIVMKSLEKDRARRYETASGLALDIERHLSNEPVVARPPSTAYRVRKFLRRNRVALTLATMSVCLVGLVPAGAFLWLRQAYVEWARNQAVPAVERLVEQAAATGDPAKARQALELGQRALRHLPDEPRLKKALDACLIVWSIKSDPAGARVSTKPYQEPNADWMDLGQTPLQDIRLARGFYHVRFEKTGCEPVEAVYGSGSGDLYRRLDPIGEIPPGMVRVPGRYVAIARIGEVPGFFIDKHEVTNRRFKEFVDAGGYGNARYWKEPFARDGKTLSWEEAVSLFRDSTGQPGPATWIAGGYPAGHDDFPVSGVSWYEAAAYAEFAGRSLPTRDHWALAAGFDQSDFYALFLNLIAPVSRFGGGGPAQVGSHNGVNCFGALDMAGNVREWCWNESPDGRFIRGGAWDSAVYAYINENQLSPWDRSPQNGFRCVIYLDREKIPATLFDRKGLCRERDFSKEKPVDDATFEIFKTRFDYDPGDLKPEVEKRDTSGPDWIVERVTFAAAYDNERVIAELYLPRNGPKPYQSVIMFPAAEAVSGWLPASTRMYLEDLGLDCIVRSGRAFVFPVYKGTYERTGDNTLLKTWPAEEYRHAYTDYLAKWVKDFRRCVDYLETRPNDFDPQKIAFCGGSWGGVIGTIIPAVEPRVRVVILALGGFEANYALPEAQGLNYVSHITAPTLMLNGRLDMLFPLETCVRPAFNLLGTPEKDKRLVLYDTEHYVPKTELTRELLAWLDKYFGPAK